METLLSFIQDYGYLFIFIATLFEGETVVALAGFTAFQGYLDLEWVIFAAFLGGMLGDQIFFYLGRWKGSQLLTTRPRLALRARGVHRLLEKYPNLLIFGSRFMYGFRMVIPIAFGTSRVSGVRFFVFNFIGAAVWSALFSVIGYQLGNAVETYIGHFQKAQKFILLGVLRGTLTVQGISFLYRRIREKVEEVELKEEGGHIARDNQAETIK